MGASSQDGGSSKVRAPRRHWLFELPKRTEEEGSIEAYPDPLIDTRSTTASSQDESSSQASTPKKKHWLFEERKSIDCMSSEVPRVHDCLHADKNNIPVKNT